MTQSCPPQPQVSVIVPVYNQERYLEECISSIRRQTLAEWECLIINDGSLYFLFERNNGAVAFRSDIEQEVAPVRNHIDKAAQFLHCFGMYISSFLP